MSYLHIVCTNNKSSEIKKKLICHSLLSNKFILYVQQNHSDQLRRQSVGDELKEQLTFCSSIIIRFPKPLQKMNIVSHMLMQQRVDSY